MNTPAAPRPVFRVLSGEPSEPAFTIGASDPAFDLFVSTWADDRMAAIQTGAAPLSDVDTVIAARVLLVRADEWRRRASSKPDVPKAEFDIPQAEKLNAPPPVELPPPVKPPVVDPGPVEEAGEKPAATKKPNPRPAKKLEKAVTESAAKAVQKSPDKSAQSQRVKLAK